MDTNQLKAMYAKQVEVVGLDSLDNQLKSMFYKDRDSWNARIRRFTMAYHNRPYEGDYTIGSVLDVGCGTGRASAVLTNELYTAQRKFVKVLVGVDMVEAFIERARRVYGDDATFYLGDFLTPLIQAQLDFHGDFDMTMAMGTFAWLHDRAIHKCIAEMWKRTNKVMVFDLLSSHYNANHILTAFVGPIRPYTWVLRQEDNTFTVYMYKAPIDTDSKESATTKEN